MMDVVLWGLVYFIISFSHRLIRMCAKPKSNCQKGHGKHQHLHQNHTNIGANADGLAKWLNPMLNRITKL
jgi:hypothetical protein